MKRGQGARAAPKLCINQITYRDDMSETMREIARLWFLSQNIGVNPDRHLSSTRWPVGGRWSREPSSTCCLFHFAPFIISDSTHHRAIAVVFSLFKMRYYSQRYPEVDELVMAQVRQIAEMGAYVKLVRFVTIHMPARHLN